MPRHTNRDGHTNRYTYPSTFFIHFNDFIPITEISIEVKNTSTIQSPLGIQCVYSIRNNVGPTVKTEKVGHFKMIDKLSLCLRKHQRTSPSPPQKSACNKTVEASRFSPGGREIGIGRVEVAGRLSPPGPDAAAVVAAAAGAGRPGPDQARGRALPVERPAAQLQLLPVHLLLLVAQQLVDQHAGEDAGQDARHRHAEEGAQAGVQRAVHRLAVRRTLEQYARVGGARLRRTVARARSARIRDVFLLVFGKFAWES